MAGLLLLVISSAMARAEGPVLWGKPVPVRAGPGDTMGLVCPSSSLCIANGSEGSIVTSTDPTGGAAAWSAGTLSGIQSAFSTDGLHHLACASTRLCVGAAEVGQVFASTDPAAGVSSWHTVAVPASSEPEYGAACAPAGLCAITDGAGDVLMSSTPAVAGTWTSTHVDSIQIKCGTAICPSDLSVISCPTRSFCAAPNQNVARTDARHPRAVLFTWSDPTGGAGAWKTSGLPIGKRFVDHISCASPQLCMIGTGPGYLPGPPAQAYVSTDPTGGPSAWHRVLSVPGAGDIEPVCVSAHFCAAVTSTYAVPLIPPGEFFSSTDPTAARTWTGVRVNRRGYLSDLTCVSASFCGVLANGPSLLAGQPPTRNAIKAALRTVAAPAGQAARIRLLIKTSSYQTRVPASATGKVRIDWYRHSAALAPGRKISARDEIASGSARSSNRKATTASIRLTQRGLTILRATNHVRLQMRVTFTPASGPLIVTSKPFTLAR